MHYSDLILEALKSNHGFYGLVDGSVAAIKEHPELAGSLSPNGRRVYRVEVCSRSRYLSIYRGFTLIAEIDGRDYAEDPEKGASVLAEKFKKEV